MRLAVRNVCAVVSLGILVPLLAACGADQSDTPGVSPLAQIASEQTAPAANGIDEKSPSAVLNEAVAAMEATGSYRVAGKTTAGADIDISFRVDVGATGMVSADGDEIKILSTDGKLLVSGDVESLKKRVDEDVDDTIGDKWLALAPKQAKGFEIFLNGKAFADAVLGSQGPAEITSVKDVDGEPAVGLIFPETGGTLWVAANGDPFPLRFEEKGATAERGTLVFSRFGEKVKLSSPDKDDIVKISE